MSSDLNNDAVNIDWRSHIDTVGVREFNKLLFNYYIELLIYLYGIFRKVPASC